MPQKPSHIPGLTYVEAQVWDLQARLPVVLGEEGFLSAIRAVHHQGYNMTNSAGESSLSLFSEHGGVLSNMVSNYSTKTVKPKTIS